ncbi:MULTISPECIES: aldehyde dehydrogenase family protein [unclassified Blastococcus]
MENRGDTFIGGRWVGATGPELITVLDPSTEACIATIQESSDQDVDAAVAAATAALPVLSRMPVAERADLLQRLAAELERRSDRLAMAISQEMGMPLKQCVDHQVICAVDTVRATVLALAEMEFSERIGHSTVYRDPVGVVAAITPWNYPLLQTVSKLAPALAAGCPIVLKPSEVAPLDAFLLAEAVEAAGWPAGALNVVMGTGSDIGEYLVRHPGVAHVSLTGSTRAGRRVSQVASSSIKRVSLELGGKSPAVVLPDADLAAAVRHTVDSVMINSGQTCTALTRLLVPFQSMPDVEDLAVEAMAGYRVGPASDPSSDVGPLANANQRHKVNEHLERAPIDGARSMWSYPHGDLPDRGFFVPPTLYGVSDHRIAVAREEIFGPVLVVIPYVDESHAVEIANDTDYGLAATVWSADEERAHAVARRIDSGTVDLNGAPFNPFAPFGGRRQSGRGRELGVHGIAEFTELKAVQHRIDTSEGTSQGTEPPA